MRLRGIFEHHFRILNQDNYDTGQDIYLIRGLFSAIRQKQQELHEGKSNFKLQGLE